MKKLLTLIFACTSSMLFAQLKVVIDNDTTIYNNKKEYSAANETKEGYWIQYNVNEVVVCEGLYRNDKKEGLWKEYYDSGVLKSEIPYVNGKADGYAKLYYENGRVSEEGQWKNKIWVGDYKYYFENGNPAYVWKFDETGKRNGMQIYYHENGNKMIEGEWADGKETGTIKEYYENGSLKSEKVFNNGEVVPETIKTYEPKKEIVITQPEEVAQPAGLEHFDGDGYYKTLNKWRKPEYEGVWKGGKFMDGKKYVYDEEGLYLKTLVYRNGIKVGEKVED